MGCLQKQSPSISTIILLHTLHLVKLLQINRNSIKHSINILIQLPWIKIECSSIHHSRIHFAVFECPSIFCLSSCTMIFAWGFTITNMVSLIPSSPEIASFKRSLQISYNFELRDLNLGWSDGIFSVAKHSEITDFNIVLFFCDRDGLAELELTPDVPGFIGSTGISLELDAAGGISLKFNGTCKSTGEASESLEFDGHGSPVEWETFSLDFAWRRLILIEELGMVRLVRLLLRSNREALHFPLLLVDLSEWELPVRGSRVSLFVCLLVEEAL